MAAVNVVELMSLLRRHPVTVAYLILALVAGIATGFFSGPAAGVRIIVGTGYEQLVLHGRWWTLLTSGLFADRGVLPIALVTIVAGVGNAERLMGPVRTVLAMLGPALVGTMFGIAAEAVGIANGERWSQNVRELTVVDPFLYVVGAVMTASAFCGPLWRRRLRVLVLAGCMVFLLYSGQPSDLYRLIAALAGLALGYAMRPSHSHAQWFRSTHHEARVLLASVVATAALGPVITIFSGRRFGLLGPLGLLLSEASPDGMRVFERCREVAVTTQCMRDITLVRLNSVGPVLLTLLPLVALLVAAIGLARGRRLALWLAVSVNVAIAALACYYYEILPSSEAPDEITAPVHPGWEVILSISASILLPLVLSAILLINRSRFTVRAAPGRVRNYLAAMAIALPVLSVNYLFIGWTFRKDFFPEVRLVDLLADLPERFVPVGFLHLELLHFVPTETFSRLLYYWTGPTFWVVVVVGAVYTYFDSGSRNFVSGVPTVRALRRAGGGGALGAWATWEGNSYWFSDDRRAAVAYRVVNGIAITTSEPIGDAEAAHAAIRQFALYCDDRGWTPVFYAIHESYLPTITKMGWRHVVVGEETVIRPSLWKTTGKRWQDVRSSINRAERLGIRAEWTSYDALTLAQVDQLHAMSEQWVAEKGLPEMGFTLGGIDELRDQDTALMIAVDCEDRILGITSWMPSFRDGRLVGWTLDFMRRTPDAMNGVMEFLIARSAERFAADGIEFMSLSTAPLARTSDDDDDGSTSKLLGWIGSVLEPVYGFRSLFEFKRKFEPEFHPVYMAYPEQLVLPALGLAIARAYLPAMSVRESIRFMRSMT